MLKVLYTAACMERNLCAEPILLMPCILRSRRSPLRMVKFLQCLDLFDLILEGAAG